MNKTTELNLWSSVNEIKGVGKKYSDILFKRNIKTVFDLLEVFPVFYIDFSKPEKSINEFSSVYQAKILSVNSGRNFRSRVSVLRVNVLILEENIEIIFFNKPYLKNSLTKNDIIHVFGKIDKSDSKTSIINPIISLENKDSILPIYKNIGTIKQGIIKKIINNALENLDVCDEILPKDIIQKHSFLKIAEAFRTIHKPMKSDTKGIYNAKERFKYTEFLLFQLELQFMRKLLLKKKRVFRYEYSQKLDLEINQRLEFSLTDDQTSALINIKNELSAPYSMAGLLQGDVGSGKTIIAFLSILIAVFNGYQGAILVPTEVLAFQHFKTGKKFFKNYNIEILTGSSSNMDRNRIIDELKTGEINIIIGTHSILNDEIVFKNLSLIIIDEQHKFGVAQRASLFYKSRGVDLLVMTATPIPRTMLLSVYNDLKVFSIKDKPADRKPIKTKIIPALDRDKFYQWLSLRIKEGKKAYIIMPLIEDSEFFSDLHSIEGEKNYIKNCFKPLKTGVISGKTEKDKRDDILQKFKDGSIRVILSTTVIEVGIDIKDATIIVIEDADRYGLAGIHQLRGRVGRGSIQSFCYLIPSKKITEIGKKRLKTIEQENDGFKIAEIDMKIRGGGIIAGLSQSGDISFKNGNIKNDFKLFTASKNDATDLLDSKKPITKYFDKYILQIRKKGNFLNFS